ncbi:MAG: hypothetical protein ACREMX_02615 [Gemmatimonadales bacterium]
MRHRALLPTIALALLGVARTSAAAQTTETGPPPTPIQQLTKRYTLVEVAGKSLPTLIEKEGRCQKNVTAGVLMLSGGGRWFLETLTREVCEDRTEDDRDSDDGIYRTEGGTMRFFDDDGRVKTDRWWSIGTDIDLDQFKTGTIGNDGTLTVQLADGRTNLLFRRQGLEETPPASHRQRRPGAAIRIAGTLGGRAGVAPAAPEFREAVSQNLGTALRTF